MGQDRSRSRQAGKGQDAFAHQPFRALKQLVPPPAPRPIKRPAPVVPPPSPAAPALDDASLFLDAVAGARPLSAEARERVIGPGPAGEGRAVTAPDAEALAELCDLVAGNASFDVTHSDEHVEGLVVGIDPRLLRRLRAGEFAYRAHLDLHGMTVDEAKPAVDAFLLQAYQSGKRCVLLVHGRGLNSKDQVPVLKARLTTWLARGQWTRLILAFCSARPCDGGAGALYVLLRRQPSARRPIRVTAGAKW